MARIPAFTVRFGDQPGELGFDAIRGTLKRHVENLLYRRPRDDLGVAAPVGDGADGYAQVLRV
jgi:hypothetical protein